MVEWPEEAAERFLLRDARGPQLREHGPSWLHLTSFVPVIVYLELFMLLLSSSSPLSSLMAAVISTSQTSLDFI